MPDMTIWHQAMLARAQYPDRRPRRPHRDPVAWIALALLVMLLALAAFGPSHSEGADRSAFLRWDDPPAGFVVVMPGDYGHVGFNPSDFDAWTLDRHHLRDDIGPGPWGAKGHGANVAWERTNRDVMNSGTVPVIVFYWRG